MADKYAQPAAVTKRTRFFDGQFLQDVDFIDEQLYTLDRLHRLPRLLRVTGVLDGLGVARGGAWELKVGAGSGIDQYGRQLVLPADVTMTLPRAFGTQQGIAVYLVHRVSETDVAQTGGGGARRFDETPQLAAVTQSGAVAVHPGDAPTTWEGQGVLLATIAVDKDGLATVTTPGPGAGLQLPGSLSVGPPNVGARVSADAKGLALATGNTVGVTLAPDRRLGIGTTAPRARLDVAASADKYTVDVVADGRFWSASDDGGMWVGGKDTQNRFVGGTGDEVGFWNGGWAFTVTKDRHVGIGTRAPENAEGWGRALEVRGPASSKLSVSTDSLDTRVLAHDTGFWGAPGGMILGTKQGKALTLATAAKARLTITEGGHLGIGTIAPENAEGWGLAVELKHANNTRLTLTGAAHEGRVFVHPGFWGAPAGMVVGTKGAHSLSLATNAATRLTVDANGNVGIGTTSLDVGPTAESWKRYVDVRVADGGNRHILGTKGIAATIGVHDAGVWGAPAGMVIGTHFAHPITFVTGTAARLTLTANGHLGLGTTAPENAENWQRVLEVRSPTSSRLSLSTSVVEGRVFSHDTGFWGAPAGMVVGTKGAHNLSFATSGVARVVVGDPKSHTENYGAATVKITRPKGEKAGGKFVFLELHQDDDGTPKVPLVRPSIRFHHGNRYWWRIEGAMEGIHFKHGDTNDEGWINIFALSCTNPSDARLKEDVEEIGDALGTVGRLRGVRFGWRAGTRPDGMPARDVGLIAQEVEQVLPELVRTTADDVKTLDYARLTAVLVQAVKEQQEQIAALRRLVEGGTHA